MCVYIPVVTNLFVILSVQVYTFCVPLFCHPVIYFLIVCICTEWNGIMGLEFQECKQ